MKKKYLIVLIILLLITIVGCTQNIIDKDTLDKEDENKNEGDLIQSENKESSLKNLCESNEGIWVEDAPECESVSKDFCEANGGIFNECGSACRNNPEAQMCTMECVMFCSFENNDKEVITVIGKVIVINENTIDVVLDDVAQRFKVEDSSLLTNIKQNDVVEIKFENIKYNQNTIIDIKLKENLKICTREYAPVCGINGITYATQCSANGVEIAYSGECSSKNAHSDPKICTREYMPVCGADNVTYSNKCEAGNMQIESEGVC